MTVLNDHPSARVEVQTVPRVGIFTPYDLIPGGGEKYLLTIAEHLSRSSKVYLVVEELYSEMRLKTLGRELDLELDQVRVVRHSDVGTALPFDTFIAVGNEIVPPVPALGRRNYFLCQFPFPRIDRVLIERRPHWDHYDEVLVYSEFVRQNVLRVAQVNTLPAKPVSVLAPACFDERDLTIDEEQKLQALASQRGKVIIVTVGRFFPGEHCKRHDVMIAALRELLRLGGQESEVELHLAGTLPPANESRDYYLELLDQSKGLPVHFHLNVDIDTLQRLYRAATFYWHAAGIYSDPMRDPETMEHFGIAVVEGMANGCVPLVVNKGGPADIVELGASGLHYATRHELARKTAELLTDQGKLAALRSGAIRRARAFSKGAFIANLDSILQPSTLASPR